MANVVVDNNASRVDDSSTEIMLDSGGGSQDEGDSLDDDEARSAPSDSTGSLVESIVPDWNMEDSEEWEAVEDDDYRDDSGTDEVGKVGEVGNGEVGNGGVGNGASENGDDHDEGSRNNCSPDVPSITFGCSQLVGCAHGTVSCLEIFMCPLQQRVRETEAETEAGQRDALHYPQRRCCRRRGRRATWVPPPLRRASGPLVQAQQISTRRHFHPTGGGGRR